MEIREQMLEKRERLRRWIPSSRVENSAGGANHIAVYAKDLEATAAFYTEVMGMPLIEVIDNRDWRRDEAIVLRFPPYSPIAQASP